MESGPTTHKRAHLFTVDILIEEGSNGLALEQLLHVLNTPEIRDYRIMKGIELGAVIETALKEHTEAGKPAPEKTAKNTGKTGAKADAYLTALITGYQEKGTLVRLTAIKGKGVKLSIPCRVLNLDAATNNLSVYHVDEKKVYMFGLNEIDDITAN